MTKLESNDEGVKIRMTKSHFMSLRHSSFEFRHSFVIRHLNFDIPSSFVIRASSFPCPLNPDPSPCPPTSLKAADSVRTARPLKYAQYATFREPLQLELGGRLPEVTVAFETYGRLNRQTDNAVLICHALSGDSHVAQHDADDDPGWWDVLVGPGKPIDTDRYFVICPNCLGGCRGTTGPDSLNPATGRPYATDFPVITIGDIVEVQRRLVDHLGIQRLRAVIGGSLGGHMTLTWATHLPERVAGAVAVATSARLTSQALAFDVVGRNAILRDPAYHKGRYYDQNCGPTVGLAIARMLGHITYLSRESMMQKFDAERLKPRRVQTQFETNSPSARIWPTRAIASASDSTPTATSR